MTTAVDIHAPQSYGGIQCSNCKQTSSFDACMRDANGYRLHLDQTRCPRCGHHTKLVRRPCPEQPGKKYTVVKVIRQGVVVPTEVAS